MLKGPPFFMLKPNGRTCYCGEPSKAGWAHTHDCCWLKAGFPSFVVQGGVQ